MTTQLQPFTFADVLRDPSRLYQLCADRNTAQQMQRGVLPARRRVVVMGDVHGDQEALRANLEDVAGVMKTVYDKNSGQVVDLQWVAEPPDTAVVLTGDIWDGFRPNWTYMANKQQQTTQAESLDANDELVMVLTLDYLKLRAMAVGGDVFKLTGNHEIMNVDGQYSHVTPRALAARKDAGKRNALMAALFSCGVYGVLQIGDWIFCHGGVIDSLVNAVAPLSQQHTQRDAQYNFIDRVNQATRGLWSPPNNVDNKQKGNKTIEQQNLENRIFRPPELGLDARKSDSLVWNDEMSDVTVLADCTKLLKSLASLGYAVDPRLDASSRAHLVVGHTTQTYRGRGPTGGLDQSAFMFRHVNWSGLDSDMQIDSAPPSTSPASSTWAARFGLFDLGDLATHQWLQHEAQVLHGQYYGDSGWQRLIDGQLRVWHSPSMQPVMEQIQDRIDRFLADDGKQQIDWQRWASEWQIDDVKQLKQQLRVELDATDVDHVIANIDKYTEQYGSGTMLTFTV